MGKETQTEWWLIVVEKNGGKLAFERRVESGKSVWVPGEKFVFSVSSKEQNQLIPLAQKEAAQQGVDFSKIGFVTGKEQPAIA